MVQFATGDQHWEGLPLGGDSPAIPPVNIWEKEREGKKQRNQKLLLNHNTGFNEPCPVWKLLRLWSESTVVPNTFCFSKNRSVNSLQDPLVQGWSVYFIMGWTPPSVTMSHRDPGPATHTHHSLTHTYPPMTHRRTKPHMQTHWPLAPQMPASRLFNLTVEQ